uniref:MYND-type domain-containing protein n=1 Tax=Anopheles stephensi TaxID=30069 RepID=A0A182YE96_ANOST
MDLNPGKRYSARDLYQELPAPWKARLFQLLRDHPIAHENKPALFGEIFNQLCQYSYLARFKFGADLKDDNKARLARIKGNEMYHPRVMKYNDALVYYNEAIAFAPQDSVDRAIAYANRSIICLEQGMYGECLVNTQLARESSFPQRFLGILAIREAKAKAACQAMRQQNKVGGNRNTNRNRHQAKDLRLHTLIPCEGCTMVMYCSEDCLSKARLQYHRYECTIIRNLWNLSGVYAITVWRTIAKAILSFQNLQAMKEYLEMTLQLNQLCDIAANSLALTPYRTNINPALPFRTFLAAIMHRMVLDGTQLGPFCVYDPAMNRLLCDLILHYLNVFSEIERT